MSRWRSVPPVAGRSSPNVPFAHPPNDSPNDETNTVPTRDRRSQLAKPSPNFCVHRPGAVRRRLRRALFQHQRRWLNNSARFLTCHALARAAPPSRALRRRSRRNPVSENQYSRRRLSRRVVGTRAAGTRAALLAAQAATALRRGWPQRLVDAGREPPRPFPFAPLPAPFGRRFGFGAGDAGAEASTLTGDGLLLVNVARRTSRSPAPPGGPADAAPVTTRGGDALCAGGVGGLWGTLAKAGGPSFLDGSPSPPEPTARVALQSFAF